MVSAIKGLLGQNYVDPMMGALRSAGQAASQFAGYHKAPVSMGQMLGAMGGAAMQGRQQAMTQNMAGATQMQQMQHVQAKMEAAKVAAAKAKQLETYADSMARQALMNGDPKAAHMWKMNPNAMMQHQFAIEQEGVKAGLKDPKTTTAQLNAKMLYPDDPAKRQAYVQQVTTMNKAPTVNVTNGSLYGKPPAGMAWVRNQDQTVQLDERGVPKALPIVGSKADLAKQAQVAATEVANKSKGTAAGIVVEDIDRALGLLETGSFTSGFGAETAAEYVAGSDAANMASLISTVQSNMGFDRLQAMRDASPTGGALGAINKSEMDLLQAALGSLSMRQSKEQLEENLLRVRKIYGDIVHGTKPAVKASKRFDKTSTEFLGALLKDPKRLDALNDEDRESAARRWDELSKSGEL